MSLNQDPGGHVVGGAMDCRHTGEADTTSPPLALSRKGGLPTATKSINAHGGPQDEQNTMSSSTDSGTTASMSTTGSSISTVRLPTPDFTSDKNEGNGTMNNTATSDSANSSAGSITALAGPLDALINTEIHTPRPDFGGVLGATSGDGAAANGAGTCHTGGKKKGFFSKRFFGGTEKNAAGRNGSNNNSSGGGGGNGGRYNDDPSASAFSNANLKGRDPAGMTSTKGVTRGSSRPATQDGGVSTAVGTGSAGRDGASSKRPGAGSRGAAGAIPPSGDDFYGTSISSSSRSMRSTLGNVGNRTINRGGNSSSISSKDTKSSANHTTSAGIGSQRRAGDQEQRSRGSPVRRTS